MNNLLLTLILFLFCLSAFAQDEGQAVAKERFERDKGIFFAGGVATSFADKLQDYRTAPAYELGYLKRLNKILSIGGNLSYFTMKYDEEKTYPYYFDRNLNYAIELYLRGGDVSMASAGFLLKLNLIPVSDNSVFSVYGIANPFVAYSVRKALQGESYYFEELDADGLYNDPVSGLDPVVWDNTRFPKKQEESKFTGGLHAGFGVEFMPVKKVSFFAQATVSYTLPILYIDTRSYLSGTPEYTDVNGTNYYDAQTTHNELDFPIVSKGFPALTVKFGLSVNF